LSVTVIEAAFFRLLMSEIGSMELLAAGLLATTGTAVDLTTVTTRADEESPPTLRGTAKALPEKQLNVR